MTPIFSTGDVITPKGRSARHYKVETVSESLQCYWVSVHHGGYKRRYRVKFERQECYTLITELCTSGPRTSEGP